MPEEVSPQPSEMLEPRNSKRNPIVVGIGPAGDGGDGGVVDVPGQQQRNTPVCVKLDPHEQLFEALSPVVTT